jgi:hypothetical protein
MAYDEANSEMVLFGGTTSVGGGGANSATHIMSS